MEHLNFLTLALASFIFAITPGPGIVAVLAVTINRGFWNGAAMSLGEVTGDMIYLLVVMISVASFAEELTAPLLVVRVLGAIYLGWLGYQQFKSPPLVVGDALLSSRKVLSSFATGFMISLTNPKVMVFYLSFLPLFIDMTMIDVMTGSQVFVVMFFSVLAGPLLVAAMGHKARKFASHDIYGRWVNRFTGLALIAVALALVITI